MLISEEQQKAYDEAFESFFDDVDIPPTPQEATSETEEDDKGEEEPTEEDDEDDEPSPSHSDGSRTTTIMEVAEDIKGIFSAGIKIGLPLPAGCAKRISVRISILGGHHGAI